MPNENLTDERLLYQGHGSSLVTQYESSTRTPKADMRNKLSEALNINTRYFFDSRKYAAEDIMFYSFELDDSLNLQLTPFEEDWVG